MKVKLLTKTAKLPVRGSSHAAGSDIHADESLVLKAGERAKISTGVAASAFKGYYINVEPRSGLALKYGIQVLGGIVDEDYTGEIFVILYNSGDEDLEINLGDRIAQLIQKPYNPATPYEVKTLKETLRGGGGFGSTGV